MHSIIARSLAPKNIRWQQFSVFGDGKKQLVMLMRRQKHCCHARKNAQQRVETAPKKQVTSIKVTLLCRAMIHINQGNAPQHIIMPSRLGWGRDSPCMSKHHDALSMHEPWHHHAWTESYVTHSEAMDSSYSCLHSSRAQAKAHRNTKNSSTCST